MPPSQPLLTSRIRGFVCRSCLLKSQNPRGQRTPWAIRNVSTDAASWRLKGARSRLPPEESAFRFFEQTPDGVRQEVRGESGSAEEIPEDEQDEIKSTIEDLERQAGKSFEDIVMESQHGEGLIPSDPSKISRDIEGVFEDNGALEDVESQNQALQDQIQQLEGIPNLTTLPSEARDKLRDTLLKRITADLLRPATSKRRVSTKKSQSIAPGEDLKIPNQPKSKDIEFRDFHIDVGDFPAPYREHISALKNTLIKSVLSRSRGSKRSQSTSTIRKMAWRQYLMSRRAFVTTPNKVPAAFWSHLWKLFSPADSKDLERMSHIKYIGDDMTKVGVTLSLCQQLLYIESTFIEGEWKESIRQWELAGETLQTMTKKNFRCYWELGIRMFCQLGEVGRAIDAADTLLRKSADQDTYRILIPIIRASVESVDPTAVQRAWALYIRLRVNLDKIITMEDYDAVTSIFLTADQQDLALGVFKDMMLTGDASVAQQDSSKLHRNVTGVTNDFKLIAISEGELNWEDSRTLAKLPKKFNNKFFFGSWIKKLIGDGQLDFAKKVFDLMQERRIRPAAIQMNGLIGAWFRQGTEESCIMAEEMAWRMIQKRLQFVRERDLQYSLAPPLRTIKTSNYSDTKNHFLIPLATIETFTVLLQQYRRRQKKDLVSDLLDNLRQARVSPSTGFMNELMLMDTRAHHKGWVWETYSSLKKVEGTAPDVESFKILWRNMKKQVNPVVGQKFKPNSSNFTTCQGLFGEMMRYAPTSMKTGGLPRELYEEIILCFSYEQDQIGTAVALRALQRHFNMLPSDITARSIIFQLARLGLFNSKGHKPRRLNLTSGITKERIANVTKVLQAFKDQRVEALRQQGTAFEELSEDARLQENVSLFSDLLGHVARVRHGKDSAELVSARVKSAAKMMGVQDCIIP